MDNALEIVELLEYVVDTSKNSNAPLPYGHLKRVLGELKQIIISNKPLSTGEDYHNDDNYTPDLSDEIERVHESYARPTMRSQIRHDASSVRPSSPNQANQKSTNSLVKKNGLASRIKPVPAEVRGRVRELVDLISDDNNFDETLENGQ